MSGSSAPSSAIQASIKYVVRGERAVFYPTDREKSYWPVEEHEVSIHDMRPSAPDLDLERNGFVLLQEPTAVTHFTDPAQIRDIYYPEIDALVKRLTGADQVLIFGDVVRSDNPVTGDGRLPSYGAHVDYGDRTVRQMTLDHLGPEAAARLLEGRYMLMNLWRPISEVRRTPLALCDASTVEAGDLHDSEIRGGLNDPNRPSMWGYNLSASERHRWYYAPRMRPDEILAFKLYDSDHQRIQWTGHTAFDDPTSPPDAPPRESIEVRTISYFS